MTWTVPKPEIEIDNDVPVVKIYRPSAKAIADYNSGTIDPANPYVWSSEPLKPGKFERPATGWQTEPLDPAAGAVTGRWTTKANDESSPFVPVPGSGWTTGATGEYEQQVARMKRWIPAKGERVFATPWHEFHGTIIDCGGQQSEIKFDNELPWGKQVIMPNSWLMPVTKK